MKKHCFNIAILSMIMAILPLNAAQSGNLIVYGASKPVAKQPAVPPEEVQKAVKYGQYDTFRRYMQAGIDVHYRDKWGNGYLHDCPDTRIFAALLKAGADANAVGRNGLTPLHNAVYENRPGIVRLLINRKADINAKDTSGNTPLHMLPMAGKTTSTAKKRNDQLQIMRMLLKHGADPEAKNSMGRTPLHMVHVDSKFRLDATVMRQRMKLTALLLEHGANVNTVDKNGWTALHHAAHNYQGTDEGDVDEKAFAAWWQQLLDAGADTHALDKEGRSASDIVRRKLGRYLGSIALLKQEADLKKFKAQKIAVEFARTLSLSSRKEDARSSREYIDKNCRSWVNGFANRDADLRRIVLETCKTETFARCCSQL